VPLKPKVRIVCRPFFSGSG